MKYDYVVVGAGLFGSVFAHEANKAGKKVIVIEKREHIGGNCYSHTYPGTDIIAHAYGTHIFHTSSEAVWEYVNDLTAFNRYQHRVLVTCRNKVYSMPINLATINQFYGADLRPGDVGAFLRAKIAPIDHPRNLEEKAVSLIGRELYEAFIKGYTVKQWDCDPAALPPEIITRLPVRSSYYDSYFDDAYQGMPVNGYTPIFERLLEGIPVELKTDYFDRKDHWRSLCDTLVYTGPLDAYFDYQCGRLRWRSVRFEPELYPLDDFQGTSVMNYADLDVAYTRIHEPKHLHRERSHRQGQTLVIREYPCDNPREPYYPVNRTEDQAVLARYQELRKNEHGVIFGGRLAEYRYYDMHEVIAAALTRARSVLGAAGDLQQGNES